MTMKDPRPLLGDCRRELPVANHVYNRVVDQVIEEEFPQVRHGNHDFGTVLSLVLHVAQDQAAAPIDKSNDHRGC